MHDVKHLAATPARHASVRPCADAGFKGAPVRKVAKLRGYQPQIKQRREEAQTKWTKPGYRALRRVVERTHS